MTAIADAELQGLFNKFALAYARAAVEADIEPDNAYDWGSSEAREAFCAALNERLEAAEKLADAMTALDVELKEAWELRILPASALNTKTIVQYEEALAAYRQSKERR